MKCIKYSLVTMFIILAIFTTSVYAYENDTYKIEVPNDYFEMGNDDVKMFMKDASNMIFIYSIESKNNIDISSMSNDEIKEFISNFQSGNNTNMVITGKEQTKLGKTKALHISAQQDGEYADMYLMSSNKHIVGVSFIAQNKADLESDEINSIKDSFEMKEKYIDSKTIAETIGKVAAVLTVIIIIIKKKRNKDKTAE